MPRGKFRFVDYKGHSRVVTNPKVLAERKKMEDQIKKWNVQKVKEQDGKSIEPNNRGGTDRFELGDLEQKLEPEVSMKEIIKMEKKMEDLARLSIVRKEREEAAAKREQEKKAKEKAINELKEKANKVLGKHKK